MSRNIMKFIFLISFNITVGFVYGDGNTTEPGAYSIPENEIDNVTKIIALLENVTKSASDNETDIEPEGIVPELETILETLKQVLDTVVSAENDDGASETLTKRTPKVQPDQESKEKTNRVEKEMEIDSVKNETQFASSSEEKEIEPKPAKSDADKSVNKEDVVNLNVTTTEEKQISTTEKNIIVSNQHLEFDTTESPLNSFADSESSNSTEESKVAERDAHVRNAEPHSEEDEIEYGNSQHTRRAYPEWYNNYGYGYNDFTEHGAGRAFVQSTKPHYGFGDQGFNNNRRPGNGMYHMKPNQFYSDLFQKNQGQTLAPFTYDPVKAFKNVMPEYTYRAGEQPEATYDFHNLHANAYPYTPEGRVHESFSDLEDGSTIPGSYYQNYNQKPFSPHQQLYGHRYRRNIGGQPDELKIRQWR